MISAPSRYLYALWLALFLTACASAPKTPRQYFAATYQLISATSDSIVTLAESGQIMPDEGLRYHDKLEVAKSLTDEGRRILQCRDAIKSAKEADEKCGSGGTAESNAAMARRIINQIQLALEKRK
jgi:hypothetical protein